VAEWATHDVAVPGLQQMDDDQAHRAMDLLVETDAQANVQEAVSFAVADLLILFRYHQDLLRTRHGRRTA
jgi:hypothetical protein